MILSVLDSIITDSTIVWWVVLVCLGLAVIFGFGLAALYKFFKKKIGFSTDLPLSLILMPIGVTAIVYISRIIGLESSTARTTLGFSFAGILCITRFRSTQKDATDLIFISTGIILGFLCGFGYVTYAAIVAVLVAIVIVCVYFTKFHLPSNKEFNLKVVVPESLNFDNLFDDVLNEYAQAWTMKSVKSTDFGTLFEITYVITLKDVNKQKELIDKIRERNGNLTVSLSVRRFNAQAV
jgi:hypothetical protein